MQIIDNVLPPEQLKMIQEVMQYMNFPWYYHDYVSGENDVNNYYFTHPFYIFSGNNFVTTPHFQLLTPLIDVIKPKALIRAKGNLYPSDPTQKVDGFHTDHEFANNAAIFYVNTNNGDTIFENGDKVEAKENRFVLFDGSTPHSSTRCSDAKVRININFNYF